MDTGTAEPASVAAPAAVAPRMGWLWGAGLLLVALLVPGVLLGAAVAYGVWRWLRPQRATRWAGAVLAAIVATLFAPDLLVGWPVRLVLGGLPPGSSVLSSVVSEALFGPLVVQAVLARAERGGARRTESAAAAPPVGTDAAPDSQGRPAPPVSAHAHPPGGIRLGVDQGGRVFDLTLGELAQHVFIPGASMTGKTTTLTRLADGALASGYGVIIVDCKGGGLRTSAERLATHHQLEQHIFSPSDPASLGYNPCTGAPAHVANKLVGSFRFEGASAFYGDVAMRIIPTIVAALQRTRQPVTLDTLYAHMRKDKIAALKFAIEGDDRLFEELVELEADLTGPVITGLDGFRTRLGALRVGAFGPLLRTIPALAWDRVLARPSVAYVELATMAADQDVALLGRVIIQDLKQVAEQRIQTVRRGEEVSPFLLIFDEFAALDEANQIRDLLLQGRAATLSIVVSTQHIPENVPVRKATLASGLVLAHRTEATDAEALAVQFGTRRTTKTTVTSEVTEDTSDPRSTSIQEAEEFNITPNTLANLPVGQVAVRSVYRTVPAWRAVVKVEKEQTGA